MSFSILSSRIQIPSSDPQALVRERSFASLLKPETRLGLVVAGPGFGKTQWVAEWARQLSPAAAWLTLGHREDDAHSLLIYLRAAWLARFPKLDSSNLDDLLRQGFAPDRWRPLADAFGALLEAGSTCIVIDDLHHLQGEALQLLEYLIQFSPNGVGWLLMGREAPTFSYLNYWMQRGWVSQIGPEQLRFQVEELSRQGVSEEVIATSGGWPMAVDSGRRTGEVEVDPERLFNQVWKSLEPELQELLSRCSVFEFLDPGQAAQLCPHLDTRPLLARAAGQGVFLQPYAGSYRFHPYARAFLLERLRVSQGLALASHQAAVPVALSQGDFEEALWHLFESGAQQQAAQILSQWGPQLLEQGAFRKLLHYVEQIQPQDRNPDLRLAYAQSLALSHQFERGLSEFTQLTHSDESSVRGQALLGAGKILVDTLQPVNARALLRKAYPQVSRPQRGQILLLLAENALNQGDTRRARRYRKLALTHWTDLEDRLDVRLHLRSGNLDQARESLLREADGSGAGHRNESLLLAYLATLQGDWSSAELLARSCLRQAQAAQEAFSEGVAWMRLGHALQLKPAAEPEEVRSCYVHARRIMEQMGAPRLLAEVLMGEALFCAHAGEWARSYDAALQGLDLTRQAGDAWLSAWLQLVSAIAARQGLHPAWSDLMQASRMQFEQVGDRFGQFLVDLWTDPLAARAGASEAGFAFLLERPTLFGPRQTQALPESTSQEVVAVTPEVAGLRICLLGPLQVWRAGQEVPHKLWKRKKARELLGILLSLRGGFISKERLWDLLFPDSTPQAAARDLRVLLHALFEVLDPERPHNAPARCVTRRDDHYALPWGDEVSLDLIDFERFMELAQEASGEEAAHLYSRALDLVRGDYLQEFPYADWAAASRERWKQQVLEATTRLADHYVASERWEQVAEIAHQMLQRDRCWEQGYQLLMRGHLRQGRLAQAARVYDQCRQALQEELGVEPGEATEELYAQALG